MPGWYNTAFRLSTGRVIRSAIAGARPVAAGVASSVITGSAGESMGRNIVKGIGSTAADAFNAGQSIGQAAVRGLTSALGESGQALSKFGQQLSSTISDFIGGTINLVSSLVGTAGKLAGGAVGALLSGGGAVAGGVAGLMLGNPVGGALVGAAVGGLAATAVAKVGEAITEMFGGLLGSIGHAIGAIGQTIGGVIETVNTVLHDLTQTAIQFSREVSQVRAQTGLGWAASAAVTNRFGAVGVNASSVFAGQNPYVQNIKAGLFGLPGVTSPNFQAAYAEKYQSLLGQGMAGYARAQYMSQMLNMTSPEAMRMAMMPPGAIRSQLAFQNSLGVGGRSGVDLDLGEQRVVMAVQAIKLKLIDLASPLVLKGLGTLTSLLQSHMGGIANAFRSGLKWVYADLPVLLLNAAKTIVAGAQGIVSGLASIGHGMADFVRALDIGNKGWADTVGNILAGIDGLSTGFANFVPAVAAVGQAIYNIISLLSTIGTGMLKVLMTPLQFLATHVSGPLLDRMGLTGLGGAAAAFGQFSLPALDDVTGIKRRSPLEVYGDYSKMPETHLADWWASQRSGHPWGGMADNLDKMIDDKTGQATDVLGRAKSYLDSMDIGTKDDRENQFDRLIGAAERGADASEETAKNTRQGGMNPGDFSPELRAFARLMGGVMRTQQWSASFKGPTN